MKFIEVVVEIKGKEASNREDGKHKGKCQHISSILEVHKSKQSFQEYSKENYYEADGLHQEGMEYLYQDLRETYP